MPKVVGVSFELAGKIYHFSPGQLELKEGQKVVAESNRGLELGVVVQGPLETPQGKLEGPLKTVERAATPEDCARCEANHQEEAEAARICGERIAQHQLPMKLTGARYTFDHKRLVFYFTAASRVDFRQLVRELASIFRTRIELRQIGVRDEAKLIGGLGPCGRELCCARFLRSFDPVAIKMAKSQGLALNPNKISGVCGRLLCCLRYECETYENGRRQLPTLGALVQTAEGEGKVTQVNVLRETVRVLLEDKGEVELPATEVSLAGDDAKAQAARAPAPWPPAQPEGAVPSPSAPVAGEQRTGPGPGRRGRRRRRRRGRGRAPGSGGGQQAGPPQA